MGRMRTKPSPSASGAVIFYGTSSKKGRLIPRAGATPHQQSVGVILTPPLSPLSPPRSSLASVLSDSSSSSFSGTSGSVQDAASSITSISSRDFSAIIALAKDTALLFTNAPYIQLVAGIVQQIIQIVDDVRTNKERSLELVDKVTIYAKVIFEALRSPQIDSGLDNLKADLVQIASVLEAIYKTLQSMSEHSITARINRVVLREAMLSRIEEQDRRLDTIITSFQLKSSIALRSKTVPPEVTLVPVSVSPPRPFTRLRSKPHIMFGRQMEIDRLVNIVFAQMPARVAVLGPGGIGKTSVALSVLHNPRIVAHFGVQRLFVSCEAATSVDHIIGDLALSLHMTANNVPGQLFDAVLDRLRQGPFLVALDNFETPWETPRTKSDVEILLQELAALDTVTLLVTIRGSQHPAGVTWSELLPPLQPVDLDSAAAIFQAISHKMDEHAIKLMKAVDCVPLAVTLLGNLAAVDGETPEVLWQRWSEESISMVERGTDRLTSLDCSIELSLSSPRLRREPDAVNLLSLLSLLPDGVSCETVKALECGVPGIIHTKRGISALRQNALLAVEPNGALRMLSPVRLYMHAHHQPAPEARRFLQDYFLALANQGTTHHDIAVKKRLCAEAGNIEALLVDALNVPFNRPLDIVVEAVLAFCHHTYLFGMGSSVGVSLAVEKLRDVPVPAKVDPANTVPRVIPNQRSARPRRFGGLRFWKDAPKPLPPQPLEDDKAIPVTDDTNLTLKLQADCLGCWGQLLSRQSRFTEAEKKFRLAVQIHLKAGDTAGHAYDLHNLGCLLSRDFSTFEEARTMFADAMHLHEQIGDKIGIAYDYMGYGQLALLQAKHEEAEETLSKALQLFLECTNTLGQASALNSLGEVALGKSKFRQSESLFSEALELNTKVDDVIGRAESLAGLACSFLLRSNFTEARHCIEEAIVIRAPTENPDHFHLLGRVFLAEYKFQQAEEVLRRAHSLHVQMKDESGIADGRHYLIIIDIFQGRVVERDGLRPISREDTAGFMQRISDVASLYPQENLIGQADILATSGVANILISSLTDAKSDLRWACSIHADLGSTLAQAFDLYHLGCLYLRRGRLDKATSRFRNALDLHQQCENLQGQADDHNKLAEIAMRQGRMQDALTGSVCDALKLHTQIADIGGQGDDIYIQACVFLEQTRLAEAEVAIRKALELHSQAGVAYAKALDLATLNSVLWQQLQNGSDSVTGLEAAEALTQAAELFHRCGAAPELNQCLKRFETLDYPLDTQK